MAITVMRNDTGGASTTSGMTSDLRDFCDETELAQILPSLTLSREVDPRPRLGDNEGETKTEMLPDVAKAVTPLIRLGGSQHRRFQVLQQWEGAISEVAIDSVWAELCDLTNPSNSREFVEIPLVEISLADLPLVVEGAVFYWIIGYETSLGGQIRRVSEIRLRRAPTWSHGMLESIQAHGDDMFRGFTADDGGITPA